MGVCVDWLGTVTSIKSSWIVVYLWVYVLTVEVTVPSQSTDTRQMNDDQATFH
jgi:hypothetical protein